MAYINSNTTILQAVLTKKGKEIMLGNNSEFVITKYALSDDGVNYNTMTDTLTGDVTYSAPVFEPLIQADNAMKYKLLRSVVNYGEYMSGIVIPRQIPSNEYSIVYRKEGNTTFTLHDFKNEQLEITFSLRKDNTLSLSDNFIVDMSDFWQYNNFAFNIIGVSPVGFINSEALTANYWHIADTTFKTNGTIKPVIVGLSTDAKNAGSNNLADFGNSIGSSAITFRLQIPNDSAIKMYRHMSENFLSSISGKIVIRNNDRNVVPATDFYGTNSSYTSISVPISITITT